MKQPKGGRQLKNTGIRLYSSFTSSLKLVCFNCRVCFHKSRSSGTDDKPCPNCQKPMLYAGTAFRAPPKRDVKEWAKLEVLVRDGMRFNYYGGNGKLPATVKEAKRARSARKRATLYARRNAAGKRVLVTGGGNWSDRYQLPE